MASISCELPSAGGHERGGVQQLPAIPAYCVGGGSVFKDRWYVPSFLSQTELQYFAEAAIVGAVDYKQTLGRKYESDDAYDEALSKCHKRSAERVLRALLANGGASILYTERKNR